MGVFDRGVKSFVNVIRWQAWTGPSANLTQEDIHHPIYQDNIQCIYYNPAHLDQATTTLLLMSIADWHAQDSKAKDKSGDGSSLTTRWDISIA
jgi:hypothetical protein